jgi:hypothetical protein
MSPKSLRLAYWIATVLFALLLVMDGLGGVTQAAAGQESLLHLGYPVVFLSLMAVPYALWRKAQGSGIVA